MALPREMNECSLGLETSHKNMRLKLHAAEDSRHFLQGQVFSLEDRVIELTRQVELKKAEAGMNQKAFKKCMEEKAALTFEFNKLLAIFDKLEKESSSFEHELESYIDSLDEENAQENEEPDALSLDQPEEVLLITEIEALEKDKQRLLTKITQAEEEAAALVELNKLLEQYYNRLLLSVKGLQQRSDRKNSTSDLAGRKRKSKSDEDSPEGMAVDSSAATDLTNTPPLSPLRHNTPEFRSQKK